MAKYIEREALISDLNELPEQERIEYMGIYDCIKSQPTVEVVRCRDCRYRGSGDVCPMFHLCYSVSEGYYWGDFKMDNKFCSYGAKKDGDTE